LKKQHIKKDINKKNILLGLESQVSVSGPFSKGHTLGPLLFLVERAGNHFNVLEKKKSNDASFDVPKFQSLWWLKN